MSRRVPASRSTQAGLNRPDTIKYTAMKRPGASMLVEFARFDTFTKALDAMKQAFPDKMFALGYSDKKMNQLLLDTDEEVIYLKLIESGLKE